MDNGGRAANGQRARGSVVKRHGIAAGAHLNRDVSCDGAAVAHNVDRVVAILLRNSKGAVIGEVIHIESDAVIGGAAFDEDAGGRRDRVGAGSNGAIYHLKTAGSNLIDR